MIFSTATLLSSKEKSFPLKEQISFGNIENYSFFFESLNMISEDQRIIQSIISGSNNNQEICNEGILTVGFLSLLSAIKKIDFKKIISTIIKKFLGLLEKLWNSFNARLLDFMGDDNVIKKYQSKIMNLNDTVEFDEERFIFTNLGISTSYASFKNELEKEYTTLILDLSKFANFSTYEGLFKEIQSMKERIDLSENYFDELRGRIVGSYNPVSANEFAAELFNYFRNHGNKIPAGNISSQEIKSICNSYFNYSTDMKKLKKDKSDLKEAANKIEKDILNVKLENYAKPNIPEDAQKMFVTILQDKVSRLNLICSLYTQVFSAKLDAQKDSYVQYKKILMTTSKKIVQEGL